MTIFKGTCLLLISTGAAICADTGSISGRILTAAGAGAPVSKAPVKAKNLATQVSQTALTAADGSFELSGLSPGAYEISVESVPFFLPFHRSDVQVADEKITRLDIRLD